MARNIHKETEWLNNTKKRIEIRIDKELGERFITLLKEKNISVNSWGIEQIKKYLEENKK